VTRVAGPAGGAVTDTWVLHGGEWVLAARARGPGPR
jgi:hypothetical protein